MKIKTTIEYVCDSGFYCLKDGDRKCVRLNTSETRPYCELFYPFLDTDSKGNILKCEKCLLAERKTREEM